MKLNFKKIKIHNFLSFKEEEFDFSALKGMTLVCGKNNDIPGSKNGVGKSTVFSALAYVLFGELQNKVKNENLHNRYVLDDRTMYVTLDFDIDGRQEFRIVRGLSKHNTSILNVFKLSGDNQEDLTKSSILETEKFIENEILHCDISIFLRTILLTADQNYNFFRLKPYMKKDFIEKLFNISVFGDMYSLIHRDVLDTDKDIISRQNRLIVLSKSEDDYLSRIKKFNDDLKLKVDDIESHIKTLNDKYSELKNKTIKDTEAEVSKYEDAINTLSAAKIKLTTAIRDLASTENKAQKKKMLFESKKESFQNNIDSYSVLLSKLCDKCSPIVSEYYKLDKTKAKIDEIDTQIAKLIDELNENSSNRQKYEEKMTQVDEKIDKLNKHITNLTAESTAIKIELAKYENMISHAESELKAAQSAKNPYEDLYEKNHDSVIKESSSLAEITDKYNYLRFAENIVSQDTLKKFIIKDLVGLLNTKIKYYLSRLGANFQCVFDDNMDYVFITEGGECEYDSFSSGEKMRLMIASSFAFRDFMASRSTFYSNILILDEYIDSALDQLAIDGVIKIIQSFSRTYGQKIYIISHRKDIDNSVFDNIIQIEKTNNISKIKYLPSEKM